MNKKEDFEDPLPKQVEALEMEMLNPPPNQKAGATSRGASQLSQQIEQAITLLRLHISYYPKISMGIGAVLALLILKALFFRHVGETLYVPPHLVHHYGDLESYYDLKTAKIDHWCLRGGNDGCNCNDPTDAISREEHEGWLQIHNLNTVRALAAAKRDDLDVVFYGDETTQAWTGKRYIWPTRSVVTETAFNRTFEKDSGATLSGIALGIAEDSVRLWEQSRLKNLLFRCCFFRVLLVFPCGILFS